jgi:hypothetical protein
MWLAREALDELAASIRQKMTDELQTRNIETNS